MGERRPIDGTTSFSFQIGKQGTIVRNNQGTIELRNKSNNGFVEIKADGSNPSHEDVLTSKSYVDSKTTFEGGNTEESKTKQYILKGKSEPNTVSELTEPKRLILPDNTTWLYEVKILGREENENTIVVNENKGIIDRMNGPETTEIIKNEVTFDKTVKGNNAELHAKNGGLTITVQSQKNMTWVAYIQTVEISHI